MAVADFRFEVGCCLYDYTHYLLCGASPHLICRTSPATRSWLGSFPGWSVDSSESYHLVRGEKIRNKSVCKWRIKSYLPKYVFVRSALTGELGGLEKLPQLLTESNNPSKLIASVDTIIDRSNWRCVMGANFCKSRVLIIGIGPLKDPVYLEVHSLRVITLITARVRRRWCRRIPAILHSSVALSHGLLWSSSWMLSNRSYWGAIGQCIQRRTGATSLMSWFSASHRNPRSERGALSYRWGHGQSNSIHF